MIFVTVGMDRFQFDRLIRAVDEYSAHRNGNMFVQLGSSGYIPQYCDWQRYLTFRELQEKLREADLVIAHAGAGTILSCNNNQKVPLVVPRLSRYGEAIDDHQVEFAQLMHRSGNAVFGSVESIAEQLDGWRDTKQTVISVPHNNETIELVSFLDRLTQDIV